MAVPNGTVRRVKPLASKGRAATTKEQAKQQVYTAHKPSGQKDYDEQKQEVEILSDRIFEEGQGVAHVRIAAGSTYNLGNYESLRLDVAVTIPCLPSEVDQAMEQCAIIVGDRLQKEEATWGISK